MCLPSMGKCPAYGIHLGGWQGGRLSRNVKGHGMKLDHLFDFFVLIFTSWPLNKLKQDASIKKSKRGSDYVLKWRSPWTLDQPPSLVAPWLDREFGICLRASNGGPGAGQLLFYYSRPSKGYFSIIHWYLVLVANIFCTTASQSRGGPFKPLNSFKRVRDTHCPW